MSIYRNRITELITKAGKVELQLAYNLYRLSKDELKDAKQELKDADFSASKVSRMVRMGEFMRTETQCEWDIFNVTLSMLQEVTDKGRDAIEGFVKWYNEHKAEETENGVVIPIINTVREFRSLWDEYNPHTETEGDNTEGDNTEEDNTRGDSTDEKTVCFGVGYRLGNTLYSVTGLVSESAVQAIMEFINARAVNVQVQTREVVVDADNTDDTDNTEVAEAV